MNMLERGSLRMLAVALLGALVAACSAPQEKPDPEDYRETMKSLEHRRAIQPEVVSRDLHVYAIENGLWVHRSYYDLGGQRLHANGMIIAGSDRVTVIDAPWTPTATYDLLDWLDAHFPGKAKRLVITHAHDDRLGGIDAFVERGIPVYSHRETAELARKQGWTAPNFVFERDLPLRSGEQAVELFHPGAAHTPDNIVVWFPEGRVLFGGCMVKSLHAGSLGYLGDANQGAWPVSLRRALDRYPSAARVIPGHGLPGDTDLIDHTLHLLEN